MAQQLGPALEQRDDSLVWALIDSGGPYWTQAYKDYLSLKPEGQTRTVADLEDLAVTTASAILDMACDDQWEDIRTEVSGSFARLTSYTDKAKKASNWRIDLLAHRGRRPPVVVDLKTREDPADPGYIDELAVQIANQYGHEVATIIDLPRYLPGPVRRFRRLAHVERCDNGQAAASLVASLSDLQPTTRVAQLSTIRAGHPARCVTEGAWSR